MSLTRQICCRDTSTRLTFNNVVLGINGEGNKELLGLWIGEAEAEGAKFWLKVLTDLKNRGLKDILIACCDGLVGFPQAIEALYPKAQVQLCIVHLIRNCLRYVPWKDSKAVVADLKPNLSSGHARGGRSGP